MKPTSPAYWTTWSSELHSPRPSPHETPFIPGVAVQQEPANEAPTSRPLQPMLLHPRRLLDFNPSHSTDLKCKEVDEQKNTLHFILTLVVTFALLGVLVAFLATTMRISSNQEAEDGETAIPSTTEPVLVLENNRYPRWSRKTESRRHRSQSDKPDVQPDPGILIRARYAVTPLTKSDSSLPSYTTSSETRTLTFDNIARWGGLQRQLRE